VSDILFNYLQRRKCFNKLFGANNSPFGSLSNTTYQVLLLIRRELETSVADRNRTAGQNFSRSFTKFSFINFSLNPLNTDRQVI